mmetsp:Transcript_9122/g.30326  ORF Transcript_9122/g.30326 Transcript_9122/m.30326 type:complete len:213 (+) Transcript_9122:272-910(+)
MAVGGIETREEQAGAGVSICYHHALPPSSRLCRARQRRRTHASDGLDDVGALPLHRRRRRRGGRRHVSAQLRRGPGELHFGTAGSAARRDHGAAGMEGRGLRVSKHRRLLGELAPLARRQADAQLDSLSARHEGACRLRALTRAQARHVQRHGHRDVRRLPRRVQGRELLAAGLHGRRRGDLRGVGDRLAQDGRLPLGAHARRARPGVPLHG